MITGNDEVREELLRSKSFLKWSPGPKPSGRQQSIIVGRGCSYTRAKHTRI
jgi:hypothetical protein